MSHTSTARPSGAPGPAMAAPAATVKPTLFNLGIPIMTLGDIAFLTVWCIISVFPLPAAGPLRYLCAAYVVGALFLYPRQMLPTLVRGALIFAIPVLAIISATWAPSANDAIRKGVLMAMTGMFAIYFASRLSARQLLFGYFIFEFGAGLMSLGHLGMFNGTAAGIFGQKNYLAIHMFILLTAGLVFLLDKHTHSLIRIAGAVALPISVLLILLSKSSTTIVLMGLATLAFLIQAFIWGPARRTPHLRSLIVIFAVLVVTILLIVVFGLMQVDAESTVLEAFGKDSTLTGRTYLWDEARRIMADHPMTGLGANGFWRPEVGAARSITTFFFYEDFTQFSFHNSYLELGVQLGYPGMYLAIILATWALGMAAWTWFRDQNLLNFFFFVMSAMVVLRTNTEADLGTDFSATLILLYIGAVRPGHKSKNDLPAPPPEPAPGPAYAAPARSPVYRPR